MAGVGLNILGVDRAKLHQEQGLYQDSFPEILVSSRENNTKLIWAIAY
jgi:hypothetical protein